MASPQLQNIGLALQGFSAGLSGQLPQFQQVQNQGLQLKQQQAEREQLMAQAQQEKQQAAAVERQKTLFVDADAALKLYNAGDLDSVVKLGIQRLQLLKNFPDANPEDTQRLTQLAIAARNGDEEATELLRGELESTVDIGKALGVIETPKSEIIPQANISATGQVAMRGPDGAMSTQSLPGFQAAPQESFEIIPPQEAAQMGLPADKQFQRNKQTRQISQVGSGPAVQVNTGQATEGERTAGILANRLDFAMGQINDVLGASPESRSPQVLPTVFGSLGLDYLSRVTNPAERQIIEAAQEDMLDAALTLGTGAAYTKEQLQGYKKAYFPQLGDDQKAMDAKAERLTNLVQAAYTKAGRGAPEQRRSGAPPVISPSAGATQGGSQVGRFTVREVSP